MLSLNRTSHLLLSLMVDIIISSRFRSHIIIAAASQQFEEGSVQVTVRVLICRVRRTGSELSTNTAFITHFLLMQLM